MVGILEYHQTNINFQSLVSQNLYDLTTRADVVDGVLCRKESGKAGKIIYKQTIVL